MITYKVHIGIRTDKQVEQQEKKQVGGYIM